MSSTSYAISWLYGEFQIARFRRGKVEEHWHAPELVNSTGELTTALQTAGLNIDLSVKGDVTIVHEHDLHMHEYLEVPSMKRRDLEKLLLRRVQQSESSEEQAWCYHMVSHQGGKEGVLLHQLPRQLVDDTIQACTAVGLAPKKYVPLTEITSDYLPQQDIDAKQIILAVACFDERAELIVALGDGEAIFVRELNYGGQESNAARLVTDINRTIRYVKQQLTRGVDIVWTIGHPEWQVVDHLRKSVEAPVYFDAESADPNFWCLQATELSGKLSANFVSIFAQNNITADVLKRWGVYTTAAVLAATAGLTAVTSGLVAHRGERINAIDYHAANIRSSIFDFEAILQEGKNKQEHLERLRAASHNLPSLLLQHLSRLTPSEVTLTNVSVTQETLGWSLQLDGRVLGDMRHGARVLAGFEEKLNKPPWQVSVTRSFRDTWMEQLGQGHISEDNGLGFSISGVLH